MKYLALLLLFATIGNSSSPVPEIRYFRYQRAVENMPPSARQTCFAIDAAIFSHAAPQLADLRLYQGTTETPYDLRVVAPVAGGNQQVSLLNLGRRGERTVFDAAMPSGGYSDIQLAIPGQNFIATVAVSGSQEQAGATVTHIGSYTIFDLTRERLGRSTVLHLPPSDFRFLHFRISGPIAPASVTGLSVLHIGASQPKYLTVASTSRVAQAGHESVFEFTIPEHTPVDRVVFVPGAEPVNFSRDVRVSVTPAAARRANVSEEPPPPVEAFGNLLRIRRVVGNQLLKEERLSVDAPPDFSGTATHWKVVVENASDAPLQLNSVRLEMVERDLCFDAAAASGYALYYGDSALTAPFYDYSTLFVRQPGAARAATGPELANPLYQPRPDTRPFTEKHPDLLWAALLLVIVLLAAIALRSAKRDAPISQ